jgi:N-acetylmuramoyl-L-alanine amidase
MSTSSGKSASGLYPANYTYTYRIPSYNGAPRNIDLGAPVYSLSCKGIKKTCTAPARVGVIMEGSPFYAEVSRDVIDTFAVPNASKGAAYELTNGMVDFVTGMTGSYARLSSGLWVRKTSISVYSSKARLQPAVTGVRYNEGEKWDSLKFSYPSSLAAIASFNGSTVTVNISAAISGVLPELPQNSLFATASFKRTENSGQYSLALKPEKKISGYYIEKTSDGILLFVKHPVKAASEGSLHGITIMLDPGHGGSESGAIGPLGTRYPEKTINLSTALKLKSELEALGATVRMTRVSDVTVSLAARLEASRKLKPDMFLSIHANSMEDNVDISRIQGFSAHYKEVLARPLSEVLVAAASEAGRRNRGISYDNFYVVRGTWTPSMLIETGFVPNPSEFELLTGDSDQGKLAKSIAASIAQYFTE